MNKLKNILKQAGLSNSEINVYLSTDIGEQKTSAEITKLSKMPRPTVMAALDELERIGLCKTTKRDGRSLFYMMQSPAALQGFLGQKARLIDDLIENLGEVSKPLSKLQTQEAKGVEAVQRLIDNALFCRNRNWLIIAPKDNALAHMPKSYTEYFKRTRRERQIQSQTLWSETDKQDHLGLYDLIMRKPRYIPKDIAKDVPSLILAFDDSLLIIDGTNQPTAIMITSPSVARTFKLIFELAWRSLRN